MEGQSARVIVALPGTRARKEYGFGGRIEMENNAHRKCPRRTVQRVSHTDNTPYHFDSLDYRLRFILVPPAAPRGGHRDQYSGCGGG